jgi:hypothetical protein
LNVAQDSAKKLQESAAISVEVNKKAQKEGFSDWSLPCLAASEWRFATGV